MASSRQELAGDDALLSELVPRWRNARTSEPNVPPVQTPVANVPPLTDEAASDPPSDSGSMIVDEQPAPLPSSRARARPPPHVPAVPFPLHPLLLQM